MNRHSIRGLVLTLGTLSVSAAPSALAAQQAGETKRVVLAPFDQLAVAGSVEEVFGGRYDLGAGIAELVRKRLAELGVQTGTEGAPDGRIEGTIVFFGKESARGEAAGVNVGGVRVGLGRRREVALVLLEARLTDVASGQLVTAVTGEGKLDRGGWDVAARTRGGAELGSIDLSGEEFKKSAIGDATHKAVDELAQGIAGATRQLGTFAAPAVVAPEPAPQPAEPAVPAAAPSAGAGVAGGPWAWTPYQFRGTEHFRYAVRQVEDGETQTGHYQLDLQPAGQDRVRIQVAGQLGGDSYSSTVTTGVGPGGMQMGMNQFMALGPIGVTLLNPAAWMMLAGQELTVGDGWSSSSGGETVSVKVERECAHGGKNGVLIVFRENNRVMMESCVARDVALPLRMLLNDESMQIELTLTAYRP